MAVKKKSSGTGNRIVAKKIPVKPVHGNAHAAIIYSGIDQVESLMTPIEKMERLHEGLNKNHLERLKERTALDYDKLSHVLSVTRSTLIKKKGDQIYSPAIGERMLDIADIYSYGYQVFEDENKFREWVFSPNHALGGKAPYDILDNQFGRQEVKNLIGRIEYGVYS